MDPEKCRTVVIAVDEEEHSMHALEWALDVLLIHRRPNDRIVVLFARPVYSSLSGPEFVLTDEAKEAMENYQQHRAAETVKCCNRICAARNVAAETLVLVGDARDVISETVDNFKADLLIVGSHGFGVIKRAFLGSVSDYCAHNVKCPVVIVKKPT